MKRDITSSATYAAALLAPLDALADAACVRADPRLFSGDDITTGRVTAAQKWCQMCPVKAACGAGAVTRKESGVWAGEVYDFGAVVTTKALREAAKREAAEQKAAKALTATSA